MMVGKEEIVSREEFRVAVEQLLSPTFVVWRNLRGVVAKEASQVEVSF